MTFLRSKATISLYDEMDIKHYPNYNKMTVITLLYKHFIYSEDLAEMNWTLLPGDTVILDIPCKKGSMHF